MTSRRFAKGPGTPGPFFAAVAAVLFSEAACAAPLPDGAAAVRIEARSDRHSDAMPLAELGREDYTLAPRGGSRNLTYLRDEIRLSAPLAGGRFAVLARQSATLVASAGAMDLAVDLSQPGTPAADATQQVRVRYRGFSGAGIAWSLASTPEFAEAAGASPQVQRPGWHWQAGVQALALKRLVWRHVDGTVSFSAADEGYAFDLVSDHGDDRMRFAYERGFAWNGLGVLLHGRLAHCGEAACFGVGVRDLGRLTWRGLPRQEATLSTATQRVDADGFVTYEPLIQGRYSQGTASSAAAASVELDARWRLADAWQASLHGEWLDGFGWLPQAGVQWTDADNQTAWRLTWESHQQRLGIEASGARWVLRVAADRWSSAARSRDVMLAWRWPLY
jgi:hypothetical protein